MAATIRGDDAERERLVDAAPRTDYALPHHLGLATGLEFVAYCHFI